jgi:hypothetical protein
MNKTNHREVLPCHSSILPTSPLGYLVMFDGDPLGQVVPDDREEPEDAADDNEMDEDKDAA